jgi:pimeloyl-ACP methyl ester carboxylesterase
VRGLFYRLALMPVLLALVIGALVYTGTHPPHVPTVSDPAMYGIYFDPVTFLSADGTRLEAWLVPLFDARKINEEKEKAFKKRQPAVVLVHDYGSSRAQLLPLIRPLHDAGMVVLAIGLRGCGGSGAGAANTFGLNESQDIIAGVEMLRRRQFIDGERIAVIGIGTGATAALLAAKQDPAIAALVIEDPVDSADFVISTRIGPRQPWLHWMQPLCKWAFEIAYHVDTDELNIDRYKELMQQRPVHMIDGDSGSPACVRPPSVEQIKYFLSKHLAEKPAVAKVADVGK